MPKRTYVLNGGKPKILPQGVEYGIKRLSRKQYLQNIRERLERDVGFLLQCLEERNQREPKVGFFAMVRAVMPIVETLATCEGRYPSDVLGDLGYGRAHLMWDLYRNVFLHGDEFVIAAAGDKAVGSGISLTRSSEDDVAAILAQDTLMFDAAFVYRRLIQYIDVKIVEAREDALVDVIGAIRYDPDSQNDRVKMIVGELNATRETPEQPADGAE